MNIVCATDANYMRHCASMLLSLYEHNKEEDLRVYVLHSEVDPNELARLVGFLGSFLPSVSFLQADPGMLEGFPVSGHVTLASYIRFLLPELLPAAVEKVLFIDVDTIVSDNLRELWETPLSGYALAAVSEHPIFCRHHGHLVGEYFNAGMMVIDLNVWRQSEVLTRGMDFVSRASAEQLLHRDQDVLNHLFHGHWLRLEDRWNACPHLFGLNGDYDLDRQELTAAELRAIEDPAIIHFAGPGPVKPWSQLCTHPLRDRYRLHSARTPWASVPLSDRPPPLAAWLWNDSLFRLKCKPKELLPSSSRAL